MERATAARSADHFLLGQRSVRRLGYGAMPIAGPGIWGPPADLAGAPQTLRRAASLLDRVGQAERAAPAESAGGGQ